MGEVADSAARRHGITRAEQDEYALRSYRLAQRATIDGVLAAEIVPVVTKSRKAEERVERDEEPFRVDLERLGKLPPAFGSPEGTVTAGNASTLNDGAALALLASGPAIEAHRLTPRRASSLRPPSAWLPTTSPTPPSARSAPPATRLAVSPHDLDLFEINEAFSFVPLIAMGSSTCRSSV